MQRKNLRFGKCNPVRFKIKNANVFIPLAGQEITVQMKLEGHHDTPFQLGKYKVFSDQPTADRRWRDIVAYDSMYEILNTDVAAWYNEVLPDMESQVTMREFRRSFLDQFGIEESDPEQELVNDSMVVQRTVETGQLSGKDVITAICKINACFGHINREGKFSYIYLPQLIQGLYLANDLYPDHAPDYLPYQQETGHLYPQDPKGVPIGQNGSYISCKTEWGHKKYTKNDMSADLGVERKLFDMYWDEKEQARYLGQINFEDSLLYVCQSCGIDVDPLMLSSAVEQRIQTKSACFAYVIPEIFQLLKNLKAKGLKTAILSNCSSEEVTVLKESAIYPYFD